jgi:hypothetical protein
VRRQLQQTPVKGAIAIGILLDRQERALSEAIRAAFDLD